MELSDHYPLTTSTASASTTTTHAATAPRTLEAGPFKDTTSTKDAVVAQDAIIGTHNQYVWGQFLGENHFVFNCAIGAVVVVVVVDDVVVTRGSVGVSTTIFSRDGGGATGAANRIHGAVTRVAFQIAPRVSASVQRTDRQSAVDGVGSANLERKEHPPTT